MSKSPEQLNGAIQETTDNKSGGKETLDVEVVQSEALDNLSTSLDQVQEAIDTDQDLTVNDLLVLKEAIGKIKVNVEGEEFTLEEVKDIGNLKENIKIWRKIEAGNIPVSTNELTFIPARIAEIMTKRWGTIVLNGLTFISDATANVLSKHDGSLSLMGLKSLTDSAAEFLSKHKGPVFLPRNFEKKL